MATHPAINDAAPSLDQPRQDLSPSHCLLENESSPPSQETTLRTPNAQVRSSLEQFIDSFFQEKNIRWMLVVGAAIVFGSSLMLVSREWSHWPPRIQFLTILGYTTAIFGFAQAIRYRLGLLATAKALDLLTLLLLPVSFLSLSWLTSHSNVANSIDAAEAVGLLIPATLLTWFASTRILDCWLRGRQSTFIFSYLVLCVSGALPVVTDRWLAVTISVPLWLVMTVGVVKVNRHVFWLVEEYRTPRVFGFLPIGLLGIQFLLLMASKTCHLIPPEWIGLGCNAVAATILLTGRSIANVYRQRTGDLVRPLPWNIAVPLLIGILLSMAGVLISFYGFSYTGTSTNAVVPTTLVVACLMLMVAGETKHSAFVWAGLVLIAISYQTTPTLIHDFVQQFKAGAAHALAEEKLPLAFYGLTYLPLLTLFALGSNYFQSRKCFYVSKPLQHFSTAVAVALFAMAFTHPKALFLVSLVNIFQFLCFAILFRDRRFCILSLAAMVFVIATWVPFGNSLGWFELSPLYAVTSLALLAGLSVATRFPDQLLHRIPCPIEGGLLPTFRPDRPTCLCRNTGLFLTFGVGMIVVSYFLANIGSTWNTSELIAFATTILAAFVSAVSTRHYLAGMGFWSLAIIGMSSWILGMHFTTHELITVVTIATTSVSLTLSLFILSVYKTESLQKSLETLRTSLGIDSKAGAIVGSNSNRKGSWMQAIMVLAVPLVDISFTTALALTALFHLPMLVYANAMNEAILTPLAASVSLVWLLVLGLGWKNPIASVVAFAMLPLWTTAILNTYIPSLLSASVLPLVWSMVAGVTLLAVDRAEKGSPKIAKQVGLAWLVIVFAMSFFYSDLATRVSGLVSLGMLAYFIRNNLDNVTRSAFAILANLQLLLLAAYVGGMHGWLPLQANSILSTETIHCLLPTIGLSMLFFDKRWPKFDPLTCRIWATILRAAVILSVLVCLENPQPPFQHLILVIFGILAASLAEFCEAVRRQKEMHVWTGIFAVTIGGLYLTIHGVIAIGTGASQFVMLGISIASLFFIERMQGNTHLRIFGRPLQTIGPALPAIVAMSALGRTLGGLPNLTSAYETLALFSAAGIYFYQGVVTSQRRYYVAAGAILNVTLALLWHSMQLYDFQLYLVPLGLTTIGIVELLRKEIPAIAHDPLRYIGALTILVSPIFEILDGSWWHLFSLMVLSVLVILLSIGLRLRATVYTGSAFLMADLVATVVRTTIDHPSLLWVGGLALGAGVITLAAICERHREHLLSRIRFLSNELAAWN